MKLNELKDIIKTDLHLFDLETGHMIKNVDCYGQTFELFKDYKVVSIRDSNPYYAIHRVYKGLVIAIKK